VGQRVGMSVEINVSFMSSAVAEEKLEVEGKVLRAGKNLAVIEVNARKENGVLVAQGRHTKYLSVAGSKL
jgi:acyl-coenzyme A thioesterase 13